MNKSYGFTLAEVLITLAIIGIITAVTLPGLISKVDLYVRKQQFKKVYSTLTNTLERSFADNDGYYYECYYGEKTGATGSCVKYDDFGNCQQYEGTFGYDKNSECMRMFEAWKHTLHILKACDNQALFNGCISSEMKGTDTILKDANPDMSIDEINSKVAGCANFKEEAIKNKNTAWVLNDGSIIGFYNSLPTKLFWVDINGLKRPNKWGYDIFAFRLVGNGKYVKVEPSATNPTCAPVEKGGYSAKQMMDLIYRK